MIPPHTIALVRDKTDIVALIRENVPSLKRRGRSFVGLCPFHKEKTGSFHVNADRGFFHCFGCKEGGTSIDFVMKIDGLTFPEAVRMLAERAGILIEELKGPERSEAERQKKRLDELYAVSNAAAAWFEEQLRTSKDRSYAIAELRRRGLVPSHAREDGDHEFGEVDDVLQAFRIGYAPASWDGLVGHLRTQGLSLVAAEQVGLVVPRQSGTGHYDRFRHRLMFSVVDAQGRVIAFSGRVLDPIPGSDEKAEQKPAKYINSPESPIYKKGETLFGIFQARHSIREEERAILVEGNFDVVSLHARGLKNVVAPLGTAFTREQAKLLRRFAAEAILLFDADAAGRKATKAARDPLREAGINAKVATLPEGMDPDELVRKQGPEKLLDAVSMAKGLAEHLIEIELDGAFRDASATEKAARIAGVLQIVASEDDPLVRSMYKSLADRLAGRLDLVQSGEGAFRALEANVKKALATEAPRPAGPLPEAARISRKPRGSAQRGAIVGAVVEFPELLENEGAFDALAALEGPSALTVHALKKACASGTLDVAMLVESVPPAIRTFVERRLAAPEFANIEEARTAIFENAKILERMRIEDETREASAQQGQGDWDEDLRVAEAAQALARRRHQIK